MTMNDKIIPRLLAEALQDEPDFISRGFTASCDQSAVVIQRSGHVRGVWTNHAGKLVWTAAGYNEPKFATASLPEALHYTLREISSA
jgi:hypothetical protein